ncbi:MAG: ATP-dependent DNA helicase RecG [bacterium]|nr:ATP-dependent DNA helicase RecG [bacterium]
METPTLNQSVAKLHGIGKQLAARLKRLQVATVEDVLFHLPVRHEDLREMQTIADARPGVAVVVRGRVESIANRRAFQRKMMVTEAVVRDETGSLRCVWFQQPYLVHAFPVGTRVIVAGTATVDRYGMHMKTPVIERDTDANLHAGRLVPIYPLTAGVSQKQLRFLVHCALPAVAMVEETLPEGVCEREGFMSRRDALRAIHFPETEVLRDAARRRLQFDELLAYMLRVRASREELRSARAPIVEIDEAMVARAKAMVPFTLTGAQERAVGEVLEDIEGAHGERPMQRLLNGDVGSGKTAVAAIAGAAVALAGKQVAYLAPTEVLAVQQARVLTQWLNALGIRVACWTRSTRQIDGIAITLREIRTAVSNGEAAVVIGTHAILADTVHFHDLALAIIDEQHRFGVDQRAALRRKVREGDGVIPHLLSMTATPIPRTLQLSMLGDLAVSVLAERPSARLPVTTRVVGPRDRLTMTRAVKAELAASHQAFIVCGKIDDDGGGELATVTEAYERAQLAFPDATVGLLHGRMKTAEQQEVMGAFGAGTVDILVATTVIEVGVDQPNATVMIIEDAERFGLSQLHQLRGRVGRGDAAGTCFLATQLPAPSVFVHLRRVAETTDGFALAELDLAKRGPGAIFGTVQSGRNVLPFWEMDSALIACARRIADEGVVDASVHTVHLE